MIFQKLSVTFSSVSSPLKEQAPDALEIKNPVRFRTGFLVVAGIDEISNFELLLDTKEIVGFLSKWFEISYLHIEFHSM